MILGMPEDGVRSAVSPEAMLAAQRSEAEWDAVYESKRSKKKTKKASLGSKIEGGGYSTGCCFVNMVNIIVMMQSVDIETSTRMVSGQPSYLNMTAWIK